MVINGVGEEWPTVGRHIGYVIDHKVREQGEEFHIGLGVLQISQYQRNRVYGDELPINIFHFGYNLEDLNRCLKKFKDQWRIT